MIRNLNVLVISLCLLGTGCSLRNETSAQNQIIVKDSLITLFNLSGCSRREFASCLEKLNTMAPKLIAINLVIPESDNQHEDSVLSVAIKGLTNGIMAVGVDASDLSFLRSAEIFRTKPGNEGALSYDISNDNTTAQYFPLFQNDEEQVLGLPNEIALNFRPELLDGKQWYDVNSSVDISCPRSIANFNVINKDTLPAELVQDKIVIIGFLGDEDSYDILLDNNRVKTNTLLITANLVLNILDGGIKPTLSIDSGDN